MIPITSIYFNDYSLKLSFPIFFWSISIVPHHTEKSFSPPGSSSLFPSSGTLEDSFVPGDLEVFKDGWENPYPPVI
jgi:hypothetical protein